MPKLTSAVPKYRKHRASGQAVVTINGRDHYLGPHGSKTSVAEYDRIVGEYLVRGRLPQVDTHAITVTEVIARFWQHARKHYVKDGKPTQEQTILKSVLRPLRRLYGDTPATDFGPLALEVIRDQWIKAGHSRGTINRNVRRIVRVFRWAASKEIIDASVPTKLATLEGLQRGRTEAAEPEPIQPVDLETVEATIHHLCDVVADMVRLQLLTGMRPAEVCSVRPADVDLACSWRAPQ
ncbi:site-specific integrase [Crateriforma conspicua]|uniref:site-specific integrase n=1 Tax=Crateriforma conspicua TaxID=2527996 RepID=UPI001189FD97|nr:site-specific integrase [Crateriforma conspicua]QDV63054.1 hypothetical protein Mal65_21930 [Crateriforma conspicua]